MRLSRLFNAAYAVGSSCVSMLVSAASAGDESDDAPLLELAREDQNDFSEADSVEVPATIFEEFNPEEATSSTTTTTSRTTEATEPVIQLVPLLPYQPASHTASRLVYRYTSAFLESLDEVTRDWANRQISLDALNELSTPLLAYDREVIVRPGKAPLAIALGEPIARRYESVLYGILGARNLIIKYQSNCDNLRSIHPLLRDYWFLHFLQGTGLSPDPLFISPPTKLTNLRTHKTHFEMDDNERLECIAHPNSAVRYMLMARIKTSFTDLVYDSAAKGYIFSLQATFQLARDLIQKLETLHRRGVVHADIHPGNVVLMDDEMHHIGFIDFGLSFFAAGKIGTPDRIREPLSHIHCLFSSYDLEGFRFSYRDDAFKAVMIVAFLMNGPPWMSYCERLETDGAAMLAFKRDHFLFVIPGETDRIEAMSNVTPEAKAEVRSRLQRTLDLVRNIHDINAVPPHMKLMAEFDAISELVGNN